MKLVTARMMRELDRTTIEDIGIPGLVLMENAGAGCARLILNDFADQIEDGVAVICGLGNNGGDGFVIARHLWNNGYDVEIFLIGSSDKLKGDAKTNWEIALRSGLPYVELERESDITTLFEELGEYGLVVDAIFGTGLARDVEGKYELVIDAINMVEAPVFAVDIPSGLNSDTGKPMGLAVYADMTATFGLAKLGQWLYPGYLHTGKLFVVDISIPPLIVDSFEVPYNLVETETIFHMFMPRSPDSHKGTFGHALILGGSAGLTGAPVLAANGAYRSGAGLVTAGVPQGLNSILETKLTEAMTAPLGSDDETYFTGEMSDTAAKIAKDMNVAVLGPGMRKDESTREFLFDFLRKTQIPTVLDADALTMIAEDISILSEVKGNAILTPHPGEMARLTGLTTEDVQKDRLDVARRFAGEHGVIVVLKGNRTIIASPDGDVFINPTGSPAMATGGTGDVLSGMIGGFICQGWSTLESAIVAVFIHGLAGQMIEERKGQRGTLAQDMVDVLPEVIKGIEDLYLGRSEISD